MIKTVISLFKDYKPLPFFLIISLISLFLGLLVGIPVIIEFVRTHYITKIPSAILALGFVLVALLLIINGIILDTLVKQNKQNYELFLNEFKIRDEIKNKDKII